MAQENYARLGVCAEGWSAAVRAPRGDEAVPPTWKTMRERRRLVQEELPLIIEEAFGPVLRDGGVSLHQMDVCDGYGDAEMMVAAGKQDPELHWQELTDEKLAAPRFGMSLVFLDAKGFRFYAPAYMGLVVRAWGVAAPDVCGFWFALQGGTYQREHHYALLSDQQRRVIARFLRATQECGEQEERHDASECLAAYWHVYV